MSLTADDVFKEREAPDLTAHLPDFTLDPVKDPKPKASAAPSMSAVTDEGDSRPPSRRFTGAVRVCREVRQEKEEARRLTPQSGVIDSAV